MSQYILAPVVHTDLSDIWLRIAEDNIEAADRVIDALYAAFVKLAQMPGMGHRRHDLTSEPLRFWPIFNYLIIYRPETDPLEIVRVVSGYRDVAALLIGQ